MKIKHLFISRSLEHDSPIRKWCLTENIKLADTSMISIQFLNFELPKSDYYFFSSRNGVRAFFNQIDKHQISNISFGVLGGATLNELRNYGCHADFVGKGNDTNQIGKDFAQFLGTQSVTYCTNNLTIETVSKFVPKEQKNNVLVYETLLQPNSLIEKPDTLIFTSPSNFHAFIQENELLNTDVVIAMGKSTKKVILEHQPTIKVLIPDQFTEESILQLLKGVNE